MGKKAVRRATAAKNATAKKAGKGPVNRKEVREQIAVSVATNVQEMTAAMIGEANKGSLQHFKFLLEVSEVFPPSNTGDGGTEDSDALAKFLLDRLRLPNLPEEDPADVEIPEGRPAEVEEESVSVE